MADAYSTYKNAMLDVWQAWWITWPLSTKISLGNVYDTTGDVLRTAGTLAGKGISFSASSGAPSEDFTYDSNGSAVVRFKAAGDSAEGFQALAAADAGALVEFRNDSSILVVYRDLNQRGITDVRDVAIELVKLHWQGRWSEELVAITDVVSVERGTVVAAAGSGAAIELRLNASVGAGAMSIADISTTTSVARKQQIGFQWIGEKSHPFLPCGQTP